MAGIYDPSGAYKVTVTDGSEVTGIYAPDGSYNVVIQNVAEGELSVDGASGSEPGFSSEVTGDTNSRIFVGLDSADTPMVAMGSGAAVHDTFLKRIAANVLGMINGVTAQAFVVYNTFTSAANFERAFLRFVSNVCEVGCETTGGTLRTLRLIGSSVNIFTGGASRMTFGSGSMVPTTTGTYAIGSAANAFLSATIATTVRTLPLTFATLPTAATAGAGARAFITDCNTATFNATAAAGGANAVGVISDGTIWKVG